MPSGAQDLLPDGVLERPAGHPGTAAARAARSRHWSRRKPSGLGLQTPARHAASEVAERVVTQLRVVPAVLSRRPGDHSEWLSSPRTVTSPARPSARVKLGHPCADRSIQVEHRLGGVPSGRQGHDRGCDERLRHRRQVEHRLGGDRRTGADVTNAETTRSTTSSSRTTATARPATSSEANKVSTSGHRHASTLARRPTGPASTSRPYADHASLLTGVAIAPPERAIQPR